MKHIVLGVAYTTSELMQVATCIIEINTDFTEELLAAMDIATLLERLLPRVTSVQMESYSATWYSESIGKPNDMEYCVVIDDKPESNIVETTHDTVTVWKDGASWRAYPRYESGFAESVFVSRENIKKIIDLEEIANEPCHECHGTEVVQLGAT